MSDLPDWTKLTRQEKGEAILPHLAAGESNNAIAARFLNCGRCQIAGAVNRMKVAGLNPPSRRINDGAHRKGKNGRTKPATEAPPKPAARRVSKLVQQTSSWRGANNPPATDFKARAEQRAASPGLPAHLVSGEPRRPVCDLVPVSRKLKLVELTERTCKWPNGDPQAEDFGFCGSEAGEDGPYCRYHARIAYQPPTIRQRAGLRSAERIS
ncbi:MAG: hypothetical protein E5Y10_22060 [Mesorhizobium sp.]|uniref:GcrA family cell cycle regulator n=1 Tax=Mesorhizobium sp. TaxID=1871066 RepID=UPI00121C132A|nr:GcrA family cell cycle regulator [Mesorhizobium sp.]TIN36817.1 MAG: hypothetical protein E5Y13_22670 [Mesorhizobium sp.]TJU86662.1 MAG: hypothetical protein E5Y10_22060 [Mesorhizobium sp.]